MRAIRLVVGMLAMLLIGLANGADESMQEEIDQANGQFSQIMGEVGDFVADVTFNEDDIKSIIKHRAALEAMDDSHESNDDDYEEQSYEEQSGAEDIIDFNELISDQEYVNWAKSEGLEPGIWMKKFMRVQIMMMKNELAANAGDMDVEMKQQLAELESQREQMGEAMYQQMKQLLTMSAQSMTMLSTAYGNLPEPTAAEKALLQQYRDQLMDL